MTIYHGNAKKEWEESLLQEEEHYSPFIDTIYRIETKNGLIEVNNPIWTNITAICENDCSHKTYIARFVLNHKEEIDIFTENIICIREIKLGTYNYDPLKKEITFTRIDK